MAIYKRYEFWGSENGKPIKKLTPWFEYNGEKYEWQLKGKLRNFYKDETRDIPSDLLQGC